MEGKLSTSEKRLSAPIYPDLETVNNEEKIAEENNLLSGDLERLNGKVPTVRSIKRCINRTKNSATELNRIDRN